MQAFPPVIFPQSREREREKTWTCGSAIHGPLLRAHLACTSLQFIEVNTPPTRLKFALVDRYLMTE